MELRQHLKLLFVGDVMLGRLVNDELCQRPPDYVWGDTLPLFREADWRGCNLECVISDRGSPWSRTAKIFHFRSDAKNLAVLKAADINAVSLANNHTLDFGHGAMRDMLRQLDAAGIAHAGAGSNVVAAAAPAVTEVLGCRIGFLSFTDNQPEWEATPAVAGLFHVPTDLRDARAGRLLELVRYTRQRVNFLIVAAHWGGNWGYSPPPEHVEFGHALITAGADVLFGHSAHVFRGIEVRDHRPIIYSAGDFIDDYAMGEEQRNDQSFIFILETDGHMLQRLKLYPTVIRNCQARLAKSPEDLDISKRMAKLCGDLDTSASWNPVEHCLDIGLGQLPVSNRQIRESRPNMRSYFELR